MRPAVRLLRASRRYSTAAPALRINAARLNKTLHETCEWGAAHRYGEYVHPPPLKSTYC